MTQAIETIERDALIRIEQQGASEVQVHHDKVIVLSDSSQEN